MKTPIFKNEQHQCNFDKDGFVKINIMENEAIQSLTELYNIYFENLETDGFMATNMLAEKVKRIEIADKITETLAPYISNIMQQVSFWHPAFLIKPSGPHTAFVLHQDWTFVDEANYYSGNVWIPLDDTNSNNGTLFFIPQTHFDYIKTLRSQTTHEFFYQKDELLKPFCQALDVKRGEAVFFQHSVIHYSSANMSGKNRIAINCGFNSIDAKLLAYYFSDEGIVEEYEMPENFVFDFDNIASLNNKPNGRFIRNVHLNEYAINDENTTLTRLIEKLEQKSQV